jgi:hypothetical protein
MKSTNAFSAERHPVGAQLGGISGVFVHEDSPLPYADGKIFQLLRFHPDGLVLHVTVCLPGNIPEVWPKMRTWFHRESKSEISRGEYYILDKHIWFSTTATYQSEEINTVTVDYSGTCSENMLILDSWCRSNGHESADVEYIRLNVDLDE